MPRLEFISRGEESVTLVLDHFSRLHQESDFILRELVERLPWF